MTDVVNFVCVATCDNNLILVNNGVNNTCEYCSGGTYKQISTSSCIASCPNFFYEDSTQWLCAECDSSCLTCSGGYAENCTSCSPSATLRYLLLQMCWSVCPGGYYANDTSSTCNVCPTDLNCGNCSYDANTTTVKCTTCSYGYFFTTSTSTCASTCASNEYANRGNNSCISCDALCLTCNGPGSSYCSSCNSSYYYIYNVSGGYCIDACNASGYVLSGSNCLACDSTCATCSGVSESQCASCPTNNYLSSGYCRFVCPPAAYPNTANNQCDNCDGSCTFCFGPTINNCTGCIDGMVLYNFTCTLSCPSGYTVNQWNVCSQSSLLLAATLLFASLALLL